MTLFKVEGEYLVLPTGKMPMVGLGCFFGLEPEQMLESNVQKWIEKSIDLGYRGFDTAFIYRTEKPLGQAVKNKIKEGVIKREDIFITSKLSWDRHHPNDVSACVKESLSNFGLEYVDQYLMHWPHASTRAQSVETFFSEYMSGQMGLYEDNDYLKVWKILEDCCREGLVKSIGLSNFNSKQVQNILDNCTIRPAVNQCEINPYYQNLQLTKFCEERDLPMVSYTPLGNVHPSVGPADWQSPLTDPVVVELAKKYGKTAGQVALRFTVQRGIPVIPSSKNPQRQAENLQVFDFNISDEDMDKLYFLERKQKFWTMPMMSEHKDYPFHEAY